MSSFLLFPKIRSGLEWVAGYSDTVIQFDWNIVAAIILLFVGKFITRLLSRGLEKLLLKRRIDRTTTQLFAALVRYITLASFVVTVLGRVGVETSSIITVIGAAGLAVGLALQGSLSSFATGVLLVSLWPFRVEKVVQIGTVTGTVEEVHIFSATLLTTDNKEVVIPNSKIIADNIINYSRHPFHRIDLVIGMGYQSRIAEAKQVINHIIEQDNRIDRQRGMAVRLGELGTSALGFYVRVWVPSISYWNAYCDLLGNIKETLDASHINLPYLQMDVRTQDVASQQQPQLQLVD